ncbi:MAG TPA: hypothetical protein VK572_12830 [Burkholderiales bacterium]|nr:hypothetical protein [Burkholderiales bacterium]
MKTKILAILATGLSGFAACGHSMEPIAENLRPALEKFLKEKGDLCLGKFDWPIGVSEHDSRIGTRDALQMPVLEKIGIVVSSKASEKRKEGDIEKTVPVTRYRLTEAGRKSYIARETSHAGPDGTKVVHRGDFCAGKLSLDSLVGWEAPRTVGDHQETTVAYTYRIAAAEWARNPDVQKVFPMVERIVKGEGKLQLRQLFRLTKDGWMAVNAWE